MNHPRPLNYYHLKTEINASAFELFSALNVTKDHFFLDSSKKDSAYSHYSMIGVNPHLIVKYNNKKIYIKDFTSYTGSNTQLEFSCVEEKDIFEYLNTVMGTYTLDNKTGLPFIGGGIGYFSYDLSKTLESLPDTTEDTLCMPDCYYVFYDNVIVQNIATQEVHLIGLGILEEPHVSVQNLHQRLLTSLQKRSMTPNGPENEHVATTPPLTSPFSEERYKQAIESMREYMENGHIYVANMTHTFRGRYTQSPIDTYARLRKINPAPFSAYMEFEDTCILSSSPERFLKIRDGKVQTRPIKGTVPRGESASEDEHNRQVLLSSEKDKSELLMIVDLERNDLSKVCIPGSVKVTQLFEIETYATVFHLVATVEGQLEPRLTPIDCIKATFPGGSITGAPKIRAMEIIDELEATSRNIYTGCIGYIGYDRRADFNIVIRTIVIKDETAYLGVGGGITWESDAQSEYDETLQKAKALFKSLGVAP